MDFVRKILDLFKNKLEASPAEFNSFVKFLEDAKDHQVVTVHADPDGYLVFCIFSQQEWSMVNDICELTSRNIEDIVRDLADDHSITSIVVDPREVD